MSNFIINKNALNSVALTLSERSRLVSPYFLFVFTNKFSVKPVIAKCVVQSSFTNVRFDLIQIREKSNPDPLAGEVFLIEGEWSYEVYESQDPTIEISETTERVLQRGMIISIKE